MNKTTLKIVASIGALLLVFVIKNKMTGMKQTPKDVIVLAWETMPRSIDPRFAIDANSQYLEDLIHCSLFTYNEAGSLTPYLAESYEWHDPTHLRVKVKTGITYSTGAQVSLNDVIATYHFFLTDKAAGAPRKAAFKSVEKISQIGPDVIEFKLNKPEAAFASNLIVGILPESLARGERITEANNVLGCGPYQLSSMTSSQLDLVKNQKFSWPERSPKLDKLRIKIVKQESTRFAKLLKGELDLVQNGVSADKVALIKEKYPNLEISKRAGLNVTYLGFNFTDPLTSRLAVRKAISMAIDRDALIKFILKGNATVARSMLTPDDPYLDSELPLVQLNREEAKRILDQAGLKDPDGDGPKKRFKLTYKTTTNMTRVTIAKAIASELAKIGIEVEVISLEWGKFKEDVEKGHVQLWSLSWVGFKDPNIYNYAFSSEFFPPNGGNRGKFKNNKLDKILAKADVTTDKDKRRSLYKQVQSIVAENLPYIFLWHEDLVAVHRKTLKNFKVFADGRLQGVAKVLKE